MKSKNALLVGVLFVLVGLYFWLRSANEKKLATFDPVLLQLDTGRIDKVEIQTPSEEILLTKEAGRWVVQTEEGPIRVDPMRLNALMDMARKLKASAILTRDPEKYDQYEVSKGKGKHVRFFSGNKKLAEITVGGFTYDPTTRTPGNYVRKGEAVYKVSQFLQMAVPPRPSDYFYPFLAEVPQDSIQRFVLDRGGAHVEVYRDGDRWLRGEVQLDSQKMAGYTVMFASMRGTRIVDPVDTAEQKPYATLQVYAGQRRMPLILRAYEKVPDSLYVLYSSYNPRVWFESDTKGLYKRVFHPFWAEVQ